MSKLTDIKYRIDQMDGGEFQNLCDEYLTCRGYRAQYPFGMKTVPIRQQREIQTPIL